MAVIDSSIKSQGNASTNSKSLDFSEIAFNTWRPSSQLHVFSRQAQSSATLYLLFRKRVQLYRRGVFKDRRDVFKDRRVVTISKSRICGIKTFVDKGKRTIPPLAIGKSLYMSTFIFYGKANLKKMPNSSSPLRAHSQQSLSKYSIFSSSPKMIPDAWSTDDPGGSSTTNTCADSFTASSKAKVSHIIKVKSKSISYHALSLSFSLSLFLLAWQSERSNQPALGVYLDSIPWLLT